MNDRDEDNARRGDRHAPRPRPPRVEVDAPTAAIRAMEDLATEMRLLRAELRKVREVGELLADKAKGAGLLGVLARFIPRG